MYDDTPPPLPTLDLIHHPESDCYFYDVWCQGFAENLCSVVTDIPEHVAEAERRGVYPRNDDTPPPLPDEDLPPPLPGDDVPPLAPVGGWVLVGRGGLGVGYAATSLVRPSDQQVASCRVIDATVSGGGQGTSSQRYSACRDSRGEWQVTQA